MANLNDKKIANVKIPLVNLEKNILIETYINNEENDSTNDLSLTINDEKNLSNDSTINENENITKKDEEEINKKINEKINKKINKTGKIKKELWIIIKMAIPIAISEYLTFFTQMMSNIFVGHIGATELAAIALGNTFCNATGWYVFVGLGTALDTLCSQSYTAAKTKKEKETLGIIVQRSLLLMFMLCIPIAILWYFSEYVFLLLGQDEDVARMSNEFTKIQIFGLIPYITFDYLRRFMQTQGLVKPPFYIMALITPINILLHYIFVSSGISPFNKENRYIGAPISVVIVYWLLAISIIIFINFSKAKECWAKINIKAACSGWKEFLKLGFPGMIMMLTEVLVFESFSIAAGIIGKIELAAQSVLVAVAGCVFNLLIGISTANCVRIGNLLGSGNKEMAKFSTHVSFMFSVFIGICNLIVLITLRKYMVEIFSSDKEVNELATKLMVIISFYELADGVVTPSNGILRGCGKQKIGAISNIATFWAIGIPAGLIFGFVFDFKLYGIWSALTVAVFCLSIIQFIVIRRTNWETECKKAKLRYEAQKIE